MGFLALKPQKPTICKGLRVQPLPDGSYEAMVVDISPVPEGPGARLELAILGGDHKGDVVMVRSPGLDPDDLTILGTSAKVTVVVGIPGVRLARP